MVSQRRSNTAVWTGDCREETECQAKLSTERLDPFDGFMNFSDGSSIVANLTTIGRKSGEPRTIEMRFIYYRGYFYATSSKIIGKHWCQNIVANPAVDLNINGQRISCTARQVLDDSLRRKVLTFRDSPPQLNRIVFEFCPV